ncbi:MAG: serine/threonine protein kinase [Actinomyces sp.]|nr:MAG: serine/threonine protein kinase [Actinomyces sp.]
MVERPLIVGRDFGRYRIVDHLGRGTVADVYEVTDRAGRHRALKVLTPLAMGDPEVRRGFEREWRVMRRIGHPNVPAVYFFGEIAGLLVCEMELVRGPTLAELLPPGHRLDEPDVVALGVSVARTLAGVHEARVVHRDVKPSNVLLAAGRPPVLFDFGLALDLDAVAADELVPDRVYGSPLYTSPEQALSGRPVGPRSDLYSLAATLYRAATGRAPFYGDRTEVLEAHVSAPPDPPSSHAPVSPAFDAVILRGLAKDPDERWPDGEAFAAALAALEPPERPSPARPSRLARWRQARRRRRVVRLPSSWPP